MAPQLDSRTEMQYESEATAMSDADKRILRGLQSAGSSYGMCPCHLAARINVPEPELYRPLSRLLARGFATIELPDEAPRSELQASHDQASEWLADIRRPTEQSALEADDKVARWDDFFARLDQLPKPPRYYVAITDDGRRRLKRNRTRVSARAWLLGH